VDLMLPGMDGITALEELKKINEDLPVLMITAFASVETAIAAMKRGAFDYVTKPFKNDEVLVVVRNAIERNRLVRENRLLRHTVQQQYQKFANIIGRNQKMRQVFDLIIQAAPSRSTILIQGESGTGKELVARAIGLSRFIPFDPRSRSFSEDYVSVFHPLNIAALPSTLVESELFGHKRGAFTGALADREGWLETCRARGTVFLDEIGELAADIQIKLLRALESRGFNRLGETKERRFLGKIVAATNRDLAAEMAEGRFRPDLYYRLCADVIRTPTLREQLRDAPEDLSNLLLVVAARLVGEQEAESLVSEAQDWIRRELGPDYDWPGNVRELEQCVRNLLIRRAYQPPRLGPPAPERELLDAVTAGSLSADELLRRYCTLVYARTGSYESAARQLGLDRRTVKAKVDRGLLEALRAR
jgi:DNA-binding NtrC family response regulator